MPKNSMYGLVLAGGFSRRMGQDKSSIAYHGYPQREFLYDLLEQFCTKVFISCRSDQAKTWRNTYEYLVDKEPEIGPLGGIVTAFRHFPKASWIVLACDLPLVDSSVIKKLIQERNASKIASAYSHKTSGRVQPLVAIWEAAAKEVLENYVQLGVYSLSKILDREGFHPIAYGDEEALHLLNVNEPQEHKEALRHLAYKKNRN